MDNSDLYIHGHFNHAGLYADIKYGYFKYRSRVFSITNYDKPKQLWRPKMFSVYRKYNRKIIRYLITLNKYNTINIKIPRFVLYIIINYYYNTMQYIIIINNIKYKYK